MCSEVAQLYNSAFMIFKKAGKKEGGGEEEVNKTSAAKLRLQNDLTEYNEEKIQTVDVNFPNPKNIMEMNVTVAPTNDSLYYGGKFTFNLQFPVDYPMRPPKVLLKNKIFHPNIDIEGHVCLPLVRDDWKPVTTLYQIICGFIFLFASPNPKDPLNIEAGTLMHDDYNKFKTVVKDTLKGGKYGNEKYEKMMN